MFSPVCAGSGSVRNVTSSGGTVARPAWLGGRLVVLQRAPQLALGVEEERRACRDLVTFRHTRQQLHPAGAAASDADLTRRKAPVAFGDEHELLRSSIDEGVGGDARVRATAVSGGSRWRACSVSDDRPDSRARCVREPCASAPVTCG